MGARVVMDGLTRAHVYTDSLDGELVVSMDKRFAADLAGACIDTTWEETRLLGEAIQAALSEEGR